MLKNEVEDMASKEETMWKQRAKALWLAEGDRSTSFFHARANERRLQKEIWKVKDVQGLEVKYVGGIRRVVRDYFGDLFSSTRPSEDAMERVLTSMERRVTEAMNDDLTRSFTPDEITRALHQMHPLKSPRPDGRLITNNVLVVYEINHYLMYKSWGKVGHVSLKLDVSKAYDRVKWSFLERVLIKLEAFNKMISRAKVEGYVEGDGNSVPLVGHPWTPRPLSFQLIYKPKTFAENTRVSTSINSDCKWNKELVEAEFSPLDAECILGVRLQDTRLQDKLMWHYEKHGRFTVGSVYRVAQEQSKTVGSSLLGYPWRYIWKSKAPMKVLMFVWRYAKDALPTSISLSK
ncbi:UNVERIFIED_CONTAM: hypothetical protein Scaly_2635700 [Sesamum calycinum]|uniref:Reverse transcriptase zinc-binding domain-containing protein n=1 Tax=Sesamum calycinum TaxID=2727403 RepID=A0AAW2JD38_9LAMI